MAPIEIPNPARSDIKWAASVRIAREDAIIPPTISADIKIRQMIITQISFVGLVFLTAGVSSYSVSSLYLGSGM